jgi:uncharacterized protein YceK
MTRMLFLEKAPVMARWAPIVALLLSGCASSVDPEYSEKAIRGMLQNASNAPAPSDLPKVGDSDWCIRVNLALDNPKLPPQVKNQYADAGRAHGCQRALAAQPATQ